MHARRGGESGVYHPLKTCARKLRNQPPRESRPAVPSAVVRQSGLLGPKMQQGELGWREGSMGLRVWTQEAGGLAALARAASATPGRVGPLLAGPWIQTKPWASRWEAGCWRWATRWLGRGPEGAGLLVPATPVAPVAVGAWLLATRGATVRGSRRGATAGRSAEEPAAIRVVEAKTFSSLARRSSFRTSWSRAIAKVLFGSPAMWSPVVLKRLLSPRSRLRMRVVSGTGWPTSSAAVFIRWQYSVMERSPWVIE
jgi:hypothetical protein